MGVDPDSPPQPQSFNGDQRHFLDFHRRKVFLGTELGLCPEWAHRNPARTRGYRGGPPLLAPSSLWISVTPSQSRRSSDSISQASEVSSEEPLPYASGKKHHQPRRQFPPVQQPKRDHGCRRIARVSDTFGPYGVVERRQQNADYRCIRAAQSSLHPRLRSQLMPERQHTGDQQPPGKEDGQQTPQSARPSVRSGVNRRPEISREGEEWSWQRLSRTVARQKRAIGDPAIGDDFRSQQRQDDMAAALSKTAMSLRPVVEVRIGNSTSRRKKTASIPPARR